MESVWWLVFDLLGTAAFAISGAFAAISRRMDLFGIFVLSSVTAVGGGVLRDVLLGRIPPAFFPYQYLFLDYHRFYSSYSAAAAVFAPPYPAPLYGKIFLFVSGQ